MENLKELRGVLAFDHWVGNGDSLQARFVRDDNGRDQYPAWLIDHGLAFQAQCWNFDDAQPHSYAGRRVYANVVGTESFQRWRERIEQCRP